MGAKEQIKKVFWLIDEDEVKHKDKNDACDQKQSNMKIHSIYAYNKTNATQLLVRNLAYFAFIVCRETRMSA